MCKKSDTQQNFSSTRWPIAQPIPKQWLQNPWNSWNSWISWIPAPWPTRIYKLSMMSMVWNISIDYFGLAAWLCSLPALIHLLISQTWETGKSPWFLRNN